MSLVDKMEELSAANSGFTFKLYKELAKSNVGKNIFCSPYSISAALAMLYVGAGGNTAAQMGETLLFEQVGRDESTSPRSPPPVSMEQRVETTHRIPFPKRGHHDDEDVTKSILPAFKALTAEINKPSSKYTLASASNLYVEKTYPTRKEYISDIKKYFGVEPQNVNFAQEAENCRKKINSWVEDKTKDKIQDLLPSGALDASTIMVLVNAIYFKGNWADKFNPEHTTEKQFRLSKNASKPVQMMFKKAKFNITRAELDGVNISILELPYVNRDLCMLILLPDDIHDNSTGLEKLEQEISWEKLLEWTRAEKMSNTEVEVSVPKFKLTEAYELKDALVSLGMSDAFSQGAADFTGITDNNNLYVSQVFHKAFVEVNEEGTEAAAATAAVVLLKMATMGVKFDADHPFLFVIMHKNTNSILFSGRVCSP